MNKILDELEKETKLVCYRSSKYSLDDTSAPIIQYDDVEKLEISSNHKYYAETDKSKLPEKKPWITIEEYALREKSYPIFKYFLDGSRKTYKVDDIAIGERIYPIVAGQISVGCCFRENMDSFKPAALKKMFVLSIPDRINVDDLPQIEFFNDLKNCLNKSLILTKMNIEFEKIFYYRTDASNIKNNSKNKSDKEKYEDLGVAFIQNEMMDTEQFLVRELCKNKFLGPTSYLIKDGSLEYSVRYSNIEGNTLSKYKDNYRYVVGVSKSFNPELFKENKKSISKTIANLPPFCRTKAYLYEYESSKFAVWYLRIRPNIFQDNQYSGVVKVEMILTTDDEQEFGLSTDVINLISANIINERNPVCYGKDKRWANHLYPVFLTETFIKSQYLSNEFFLNLF